VSTVGVAGDTQGLIPERVLTHARRYRNSYEEAKARAETLVVRYWDAGLDITLHRPSMVVGHSVTGRSLRPQIFYFLTEFLCGKWTAGVIPRVAGHSLDTVPCDYVAELLWWSSQNLFGENAVLHGCSREGIDLERLRQIARDIL